MALHFQRPPLGTPADRPQIRILDLLPGYFDDEIKCNLKPVCLDDHPQFEALSYVWGDPRITKNITINGQTFSATINLEAALRHIRLPDMKRTLWIDAICIDQENFEEKIIQIRMMRDLYITCSSGLIWLGDPKTDGYDDEVARACFAMLEHVSGVKRLLDSEITRAWTTKGLKALESMRKTTWWTRIWTVQEVILPGKCTVMWGHGSCLWSTVERGAEKLAEFPSPSTPVTLAEAGLIGNFSNQVVGLVITKQVEAGNFLDTLWRLSSRVATDSRDKIFGLMGIIFGLEEGGLVRVQKCDYGTSSTRLFSELTMDLFEAKMNISPLLGFTGCPRADKELPSWVMNWGQHEDESCHSFWNHFHRDAWYSATSGGSGGLMVDENYQKLSIDGHRVDTITTVIDLGEITPFRTNFSHIDLNLVAQLEAAVQAYHSFNEPYLDIEDTTYADAFWRTMVGDLMTRHDGLPTERWANAEDKIAFDNYRKGKCDTEIKDYNCASMLATLRGHVFFLTSLGYIGIGPKYTQVGDEVWILYEGNTPYVLRKFQVQGLHFTLVGDCYMHGVMRGEQFLHSDCSEKRQTAILV